MKIELKGLFIYYNPNWRLNDTHSYIMCVVSVTWSHESARCQSSKTPPPVLSPSHLRNLCTLAGIPLFPLPTGAAGCLWSVRRWRGLLWRPETLLSPLCRSPVAWRGSFRWACNTASLVYHRFHILPVSVACWCKEVMFKVMQQLQPGVQTVDVVLLPILEGHVGDFHLDLLFKPVLSGQLEKPLGHLLVNLCVPLAHFQFVVMFLPHKQEGFHFPIGPVRGPPVFLTLA